MGEFKTGKSSNLDDFDFEMDCAFEALKNCKSAREEELLQRHFESLLARAEQEMGSE